MLSCSPDDLDLGSQVASLLFIMLNNFTCVNDASGILGFVTQNLLPDDPP